MSVFARRGLELVPSDLTRPGWLSAMSLANLNLLIVHMPVNTQALVEYARTPAWHTLSDDAAARGIDVEWAPHAFADLLPRSEFAAQPDWFRMNLLGERLPDWNMCASSSPALDVVRQNAASLTRLLVPTTHRYYFWSDDGHPWCHCPLCARLGPGDQNMIVTNAILDGVRTVDPEAELSGLAYLNTLQPLQHVQPAEGVFLEYAPIERCFIHSLDDSNCAVNRAERARLEAVLPGHAMARAQVLEYWLDESLFWRTAGRPESLPRLPFKPEVLERDLQFYARLGFRSIVSYGVMLGDKYASLHGEAPIRQYGEALMKVTST